MRTKTSWLCSCFTSFSQLIFAFYYGVKHREAMNHIYLKNHDLTKEARSFFMDYLKLQATLSTAAILVCISIIKDLSSTFSPQVIAYSLALFVGSIAFTVFCKMHFVAYVASHDNPKAWANYFGRGLFICSFMSFVFGLVLLCMLVWKQGA